MKILYTLSSTKGLGADRWIYKGYKRAFESLGHTFIGVETGKELISLSWQIKPDLIILDYAWFLKNEYTKMALLDNKVFCQIGSCLDKETFGNKELKELKYYLPLFDKLWTWNAPEVYEELEEEIGRKIHFIPHAADSFVYYPDKVYPEWECDIAFVGSKYTAKPFFKEELIPALKKKYKVKVYGAGWTLKDRILRNAQGLFRKLGLRNIADLINEKRLFISQDDERKLYSSAKICLNFHEYYKNGIPKNFEVERTFKIPACGGFQMTDHCEGMKRYFELGYSDIFSIPQNESIEHWLKEIDFFILQKITRERMKLKAMKRATAEHTYVNRAKQMIELLNN